MAIQHKGTGNSSVSQLLYFPRIPINCFTNHFSNSIGSVSPCFYWKAVTNGQAAYKHESMIQVVLLAQKAILNRKIGNFSAVYIQFKGEVLVNLDTHHNLLRAAFIFTRHRHPF